MDSSANQRSAWPGEGLRIAILAPFLLFPTLVPWATIAAVIAWSLLTIAARRRGAKLLAFGSLGWPLGFLAVAVLLGAAVSPFREPAKAALFPSASPWPKLAGFLLGALVLRAVVLGATDLHRVGRAATGYMVIAVALIIQGALLTSWYAKYPVAVSRFPRLGIHLPGTAADGVQPNALGGTIVLVLPFLFAVMTAPRDREPTNRPFSRRLAVALFSALVLPLIATQSRTSWLAALMTLVVIAAIRWRPARRVVIAAAVVAVAVALVAVGPLEAAFQRIVSSTTSLEISWAGRVELWQRALSAMADFPLTGLGLNAFRGVVHDLYPLALSPPDLDVAHAHNVFLQTALDTGLPGLAAYVWLLGAASALAWNVYRTGSPTARILALGLWGNLLAVHLFGLTDAIALGAKVGLLLWLSLGLLAALSRCTVVTNSDPIPQ